MSKSTHFIGQPLLGQLLSLIDQVDVHRISKKHGGEHYVKHFDAWHHLVTMLYAIIMRFDSLREIQLSMTAESRKLSHLGLTKIPKRSTLSDANVRRSEVIFGELYATLYDKHKGVLSSDSRNRGSTPSWLRKLKIMDSTTISLFSNLVFKGVGRNPKRGKKKLISLLTNDFEMPQQDIIDIYRKRWMIETLFKQLKQNFPLRYFYGESANAIKIQVWCTLIANLLLMLIKRSVRRSWSFSGLATMIRNLMMYYVNHKSILEYPEKDWDLMIEEVIRPPNHLSLFD